MLGIASEWNDIISTSQLYFVIEKDTTTGIQPSGNLPDWDVWPNPTRGIIHLGEECLRVEAFDLSGRILIHATNVRSLDLSDFNGEMVFVKITTHDAVFVRKVMVL
jgi:hypothetical protein